MVVCIVLYCTVLLLQMLSVSAMHASINQSFSQSYQLSEVGIGLVQFDMPTARHRQRLINVILVQIKRFAATSFFDASYVQSVIL